MALSKKRISVTTDSSGDFETEVHMSGALRAVAVDLGEAPDALTTPDVTITDGYDDSTLFSAAAIASNTKYYPTTDDADSTDGESFAAPIAITRMVVTVAGGGDTKSGYVYLFVER